MEIEQLSSTKMAAFRHYHVSRRISGREYRVVGILLQDFQLELPLSLGRVL